MMPLMLVQFLVQILPLPGSPAPSLLLSHHTSPALCILCVPYLSDMCLLALVLCSLRGLFVALPAESRTVARTHQGAHS